MIIKYNRDIFLPLMFLFLGCATRKSNDSALRQETQKDAQEFTTVQVDRAERDTVLAKIRERIEGEKETDSEKTLKWGKGAPECASSEFAFGVSKAGYELDAFELRAKFLNPALAKTLKLKTPVEKGDLRICTDTRQSRPMILLSSGIVAAKKDSLQLDNDQLKALGIAEGVAKDGEIILANFFHLKRFWIARIPLNGVEKTYVQLEHFPVMPTNNKEKKYNEELQAGNINTFKTVKERFASWADNNVAGHSQMRAQFKKETPVTLYEQVIRSDGKIVKITQLRDIVLSSEAQGTLAQVDDNGYDPVKARNPLFFSINKIVSLHEKYSDMVVRQRHWVEQFHLHVDGSQKESSNENQKTQADNPSFAEVFNKYIGMSRTNWQAMTKQNEREQDPAVYRTLDLTIPTPLTKNRTRNCSTELITVLEVDGRGRGAKGRNAWWQDVTLKRAYPVFLGLALDELNLIDLEKPEPGMDGDGGLSGTEKLKATDESLADVRKHFADTPQCEIYFGNAADKAKCLTWKAVIFPASAAQ